MIKNIQKVFLTVINTQFAQKVALLASAAVISQLITVAVAPILTRIYSPVDFGLLAMFAACASPASLVSCLRYEMAIMLPETDSGEGENLVSLSIVISFLFGFVCLIVVSLYGYDIAGILNVRGLGSYLMLVPILVTLQGVYLSLRMWSLRKKHFGVITATSVGQTGAQSLYQILAGFASKGGAGGLIWGQVVGRVVGVCVLIMASLREDLERIRRRVSITDMVSVAARYKDFPVYQSWGILLNSLSREWVVLFIGFWFGSRVAGLYFLGYRILSIPLMVLSGAISDVFFERGARESRGNHASMTFVKTVQFLSLFAFPCAILFVLFGPWSFRVVFGTEWEEAGVYLQLLTPLFAFRFVAAPLSRAFSIYEKQRASLIWQVMFFVTGLTSIGIGGFLDSIYVALLTYSLIGAVMYIVMLYLCLGYSGGSFKDVFRVPLLEKSNIEGRVA